MRKLQTSCSGNLLGHDGRLQYHYETRYDKINKSQYKAYLANINVSSRAIFSLEKDTIR